VDTHVAYIGVGSNLGRRLDNCRSGIAALMRCSAIRSLEQSHIYKTEPVDYRQQDWFINYVVKVETTLEPLALLDLVQSIEREAGRLKDSIRFGPRVLDLDILLYDNIVLNHPDVVIPHPSMHKRRFVLRPICDIDPTIMHPILNQNMQSLLAKIPEEGQRIILYR
jgi:2-amino-4-hydroxy-6-hydroxymethyldihydropteridine diphosphokinase